MAESKVKTSHPIIFLRPHFDGKFFLAFNYSFSFKTLRFQEVCVNLVLNIKCHIRTEVGQTNREKIVKAKEKKKKYNFTYSLFMNDTKTGWSFKKETIF